ACGVQEVLSSRHGIADLRPRAYRVIDTNYCDADLRRAACAGDGKRVTDGVAAPWSCKRDEVAGWESEDIGLEEFGSTFGVLPIFRRDNFRRSKRGYDYVREEPGHDVVDNR